MRLSIIIPAYKVADYIEKCIRSLEDQDIPKSDYEIIVTNDGSPDNSKEIVEKLQQEFNNIMLINQENQGVSMARNNGIAIAKGKYILPIDPDDYVVPNTFKRVLSKADQNDLDVLYLGFEIFDADEKSIWKTDYAIHDTIIYSGVEGYFEARGFEVKDPDRSWAILFKKEMLNKFDITYPKDVPYLEDGLFLIKVFTFAERVGFDSGKFYQRTTRKGSATNSKLFYSEKAINGFLLAIENVNIFRNQHVLSEKQNQLINHAVAKFIILSLSSVIGSKSIYNYYKHIKLLKSKNIKKINLNGLRFNYIKLAKVFNFNPYFFSFYYLIITKINIRIRKLN